MAATLDFFKNLSIRTKVAVLFGAGVTVVAGVVYYFKRARKESTDDEFDGGFEVLNTDEIPEKRILMLGLDDSGKSSIMSCLARQDIKDDPKPTEGFHVIVLQAPGVTLNVWEIGGKENVRSYWENFIQDTEVLVFVVDAANTERFELVKEELSRLLLDERLTGVPVVVVANKQDVQGARGASEIRTLLELRKYASNREIHVVETQVPLREAPLGVQTIYDLLTKLNKKP